MAARAAMSRPRQAGIGMAAALLLAGPFSGSHSGTHSARLASTIQPTAQDYVRAVQDGLTFPATALALDASIAIARREASVVEAGFARNVTVAEAAQIEQQAVTLAEPASVAALAQTIVQSESRIERPQNRSKTGETIVASADAVAATFAEPLAVTHDPQALAQAAPGETIEIEQALVALAQEAHARPGKPAMSAQAMSDYMSLYVLRERVEAIGQALAHESEAQVGGMWVANLGSGMDDALFHGGFDFGETAFGAVAGADAVAQNVVSDGDRLVYGGFVSAFGAKPDDAVSFASLSREMRGGSVGAFAVLDDGAFSLSALVRADLAESLDVAAGNRLDFSDAMQVFKAEVVARYRFDVSDWTVEPSAGISFAAGRREIVGLTPTGPRVEEADSAQIQLGVKATGVVYNKAGTSVEPSVTIMISEELRDQGGVTFLSSSPTGPSDPITGKTVGSVSFGLDVKDESGWTGFVRAEGQVSDDDKPKAGVSAGVKTQW
jgi:outer membrane autotransporter protein